MSLLSSKLAPSATISVWFMVTRARFEVLVGQLAKKAMVEKKPMRGMVAIRVSVLRSVGRSKKSVGSSPCSGARMVTMRQASKSASVNWACPA